MTIEILAYRKRSRKLNRSTTWADDDAGWLSSLKIESAHIVGISMEGTIAQIRSVKHTDKALSLFSIMSGSGAEGLPGPTPEVAKMLTKKTVRSEGAFVEN